MVYRTAKSGLFRLATWLLELALPIGGPLHAVHRGVVLSPCPIVIVAPGTKSRKTSFLTSFDFAPLTNKYIATFGPGALLILSNSSSCPEN
jgi:hypothetical protein